MSIEATAWPGSTDEPQPGLRGSEVLPARAKSRRHWAANLSDVDSLLTKLDQLIAKKRDLKQAAMQQLLTGRIRLAGFSAPWNAAPLREVAFGPE
ncbi:MAG: hypothetical protein IPM99_09170 [Rubrivivax sp.]|nr:hypothetical protein [Rubrivivax sp.]